MADDTIFTLGTSHNHRHHQRFTFRFQDRFRPILDATYKHLPVHHVISSNDSKCLHTGMKDGNRRNENHQDF